MPDDYSGISLAECLADPYYKNKLFFFGARRCYQQSERRLPQFAFVPTAAMLAGDWSAITSPACNDGKQIALKAPFINNQISPSLFSHVSVGDHEYGQLPISSNPCGQVEFGIKPTTNEDLGITKVDYQISDKHSLFGPADRAREALGRPIEEVYVLREEDGTPSSECPLRRVLATNRAIGRERFLLAARATRRSSSKIPRRPFTTRREK